MKRILARVDDFLATILIGNTLVNVAAASLATSIVAGLVPAPERGRSSLATVATTLLLLFFAEINPKIYAAYNPLKMSFLLARPIRVFMIALLPVRQGLHLPLQPALPDGRGGRRAAWRRSITEDETKIL